MTTLVRSRRRFWRDGSRLADLLAYRAFLQREGLRHRATSPTEQRLNEELSGSPSNHDYSIHGGRLIPSFQLYERWRRVAAVLPARLESLLDVGCCRGYYVLHAALRPDCPLSVGVDVYEPFVATARRAGAQLGLRGTAFHLATVDQVARHPATYGGPFQTTLLLGTYHYMFWGSHSCDHALKSHERILACLAELTTDRLILSARLEVNRLPSSLRSLARASREGAAYNYDSFLRSAESFFHVRHSSFLGRDPLLVMDKKAGATDGHVG